jgi:hypothetical protein
MGRQPATELPALAKYVGLEFISPLPLLPNARLSCRGRLQGRGSTESQDATPVCCIEWILIMASSQRAYLK